DEVSTSASTAGHISCPADSNGRPRGRPHRRATPTSPRCICRRRHGPAPTRREGSMPRLLASDPEWHKSIILYATTPAVAAQEYERPRKPMPARSKVTRRNAAPAQAYSRDLLLSLYEKMVLLRRFESLAQVACRKGET